MPDTTRPDHTMQILNLAPALEAGHILQSEYKQYVSWYIGLNLLNSHENLLTRRLWQGLWIPLGLEPPKEATKT